MHRMHSRVVMSKLEAAGWVLRRIKGSHHVFSKPGQGITVVPHPVRDLPTGTIKAIERQTEVKLLD